MLRPDQCEHILNITQHISHNTTLLFTVLFTWVGLA